MFVVLAILLALMAIPMYLTSYVPMYKILFVAFLVLAALLNSHNPPHVFVWGILLLLAVTGVLTGKVFENPGLFSALFLRFVFFLFVVTVVKATLVEGIVKMLVYIGIYLAAASMFGIGSVMFFPSLVSTTYVTAQGFDNFGEPMDFMLPMVTLFKFPLTFCTAIGTEGCYFDIPRIMSFATEPSNFAFFLMPVCFLSYALYAQKKLHRVFAVIPWFGVLFTVSFNAYMALFITLLIYCIYARKFHYVMVLLPLACMAAYLSLTLQIDHPLSKVGDVALKTNELGIFLSRFPQDGFFGASMNDKEIFFLTSDVMKYVLLFGVINALPLYALIVRYIVKGIALSKKNKDTILLALCLSLISMFLMSINTYSMITNMFFLIFGMLVVTVDKGCSVKAGAVQNE